jgi:flagellar protein FlaG
MNIESLGSTMMAPRSSQPAEQVDRMREQTKNAPEQSSDAASSSNVQQEELLNQIKALTENGLYSVRFELDDTQGLVIKVVDSETEELIRQIPPKELQEFSKRMKELQGNLVDTVS